MGPDYIINFQDTLSQAVTNNYFTIDFSDSGTLHWTFSRFTAGCQFQTGQSCKVELFYDADGTGDDLQLIDAVYSTSETYQHTFDTAVEYPYNISISRVLVRRTIFNAVIVPTEVFAEWQGNVQ